MPEAGALTLAAGMLVFGYLLGSIPFGLLLTRIAGTGDIRAIGSGNIGATNVLRTGHRGLAAATLVGDALKGTVAVLVAARFGEPAAIAAAVGAFLGHLFPVWLKFKGGKGVATFIGLLLGFAWPAAVGLLRHLAGGRGPYALLLPRRADREHRRASAHPVFRRLARRDPVCSACGRALDHAPR